MQLKSNWKVPPSCGCSESGFCTCYPQEARKQDSAHYVFLPIHGLTSRSTFLSFVWRLGVGVAGKDIGALYQWGGLTVYWMPHARSLPHYPDFTSCRRQGGRFSQGCVEPFLQNQKGHSDTSLLSSRLSGIKLDIKLAEVKVTARSLTNSANEGLW